MGLVDSEKYTDGEPGSMSFDKLDKLVKAFLRGRFLVRLSELVRAPRGLPGPGFRLPWPAGGQVGWPSRWGHFSGPGGRTAARVPFPRVRFRPLC